MIISTLFFANKIIFLYYPATNSAPIIPTTTTVTLRTHCLYPIYNIFYITTIDMIFTFFSWKLLVFFPFSSFLLATTSLLLLPLIIVLL